MGEVLLLLVVALTVAAVVFGVTVLVTGRDPGLAPAEPDGRAVPLPGVRPLRESDVGEVRFDTALRGYRMDQVDQALRRTAYDIGYKAELVGVLEAEVTALREGRTADADALRLARERSAAAGTAPDAGAVATPDAGAGAATDAGAGAATEGGPEVVPVDGTTAGATGPGATTDTPSGVDADPGAEVGAERAPVETADAAARHDDTSVKPGDAVDPVDAMDETGQRGPAVRSESA